MKSTAFNFLRVGIFVMILVSSASSSERAVVLKVRKQRSSKKSRTTWRTSWGSYDKDISQDITIKIEVRNMMANADKFLVKWFFISKEMKFNQRRVFDYGEKMLDLDGGVCERICPNSDKIDSNVTKFASLGCKFGEGEKVEGWIVLVEDVDGNVLKTKASNSALKRMAKDPGQLAKLVKELNERK